MRNRVREAWPSYQAQPSTSATILCDVCVLVAAARIDHPHHAPAMAALDPAIADGAPIGWSSQIQAAVLRLISNSRIFPSPTPTGEAFRQADLQREYPRTIRIEPGRDHWRIFQSLVIGAGLTGGATSDAWHAALAIEHGCTWWTFDRDFTVQRFPGLRLRLLET